MTIELVNEYDYIDAEHPLRWVRRIDRSRKGRHKIIKKKIDEWVKKKLGIENKVE